MTAAGLDSLSVEQRRHLDYLADAAAVQAVVVYGSVAWGQTHEHSDVDVLVVAPEGTLRKLDRVPYTLDVRERSAAHLLDNLLAGRLWAHAIAARHIVVADDGRFVATLAEADRLDAEPNIDLALAHAAQLTRTAREVTGVDASLAYREARPALIAHARAALLAAGVMPESSWALARQLQGIGEVELAEACAAYGAATPDDYLDLAIDPVALVGELSRRSASTDEEESR